MELGMIGLGRMGGNMTHRLLNGGHRMVVYDISNEAVRAMVKLGAIGASSISNLAAQLKPPRAVWVMLPHGEPTESTINALADSLSPGDIVIDGSNSYYKDAIRQSAALAEKGLAFLDVGTSGGIWGLQGGYTIMVGGDIETFHHLEPIFQTLAPATDKGYGYVGTAGAGHFVKMIHNAVEYGLMQTYAEGFELMQAKQEFDLDLHHVAEIWRYGSVVRSWLLDLSAAVLQENPNLENIQAYIEDTGEGRWAINESVELAVPVPVLALALQARFRSRQNQPFGAKLLAALRNKFGGHVVKTLE
ncbi:MAG: decarboxylating 6-phosphogluconate dehydrogenase [Chloroflexota bacterium]